MTDKERVLETISRLPENASVAEISEEIEILAALRQGEAEADAGQTIPHEKVKEMVASWTSI